MADNSKTLVELYLKAVKVDGYHSVYSIGPFGSRVSFASQQRRALNSVWALVESGKIQESHSVAVLGGGIAGVTIATALAARKCFVHLYEKESRVLTLQQDTNHRLVHPTVNFWPEMPLSGTTTFPFLDWHADICSRIVEDLHGEWREHFERYMTKVFLNTTVRGISEADKEVLVTAEGGSAPASAKYNAVFLTTGFGDELEIRGAPTVSYWTKDALTNNEGIQRIGAVSGVGDGALIDALRSVHRNFNKGRLCLDLIEILQDTGIPRAIQECEEHVTSMASADPKLAATLYEAGYRDALGKTPPAALDILDQSLRTDLVEPVLLIGRQSAPYSLTSAPIHKFMITHAIEKNAISFRTGTLVDGPTITFDGAPSEDAPVPCVVRLGNVRDVSGLLDEKQRADLKARQIILADILSDPPYDGEFWDCWTNYAKQDFASPAFVSQRWKSASNYVNNEFQVPLTETRVGGVAGFQVTEDPRRPELSKRIPSRLFGIETEVRPFKAYDA